MRQDVLALRLRATIVVVAALMAAGYLTLTAAIGQIDESLATNNIFGQVRGTDITRTGEIEIQGVGRFKFEPADIETVRSDIFREGHFSLFDILVHLDEIGSIDMEYHFDASMNTHVIDSIEGKESWWHMAYYDGGWPERNLFRMDHYPYKDKTYIRVVPSDESRLQTTYDVFREEVKRKEQNGGEVIVPSVIITAPGMDLRFEDVKVSAHNLRSDAFQEGVLTAIDVILSLGDEGKLSYDLTWFDSIGTAEIVRTYYVTRINGAKSYLRCGFVYEAGAWQYHGFQGNHIHIPSDTRVINSPEYVEYFWICI